MDPQSVTLAEVDATTGKDFPQETYDYLVGVFNDSQLLSRVLKTAFQSELIISHEILFKSLFMCGFLAACEVMQNRERLSKLSPTKLAVN